MTTSEIAFKKELSLKWGTLKTWDFSGSVKGEKLLTEYVKLGSSLSATQQKDTPRQKAIICQLIDLCDGLIYLDWEDDFVSKEQAKEYVLNY